ncbi:hypothetical protein FF38_08355 [Lucilia cuprina]|uniref:SAM domain-containing protein n=1 Tax=Lucilia cuprina TaxID=7375 RepID=A0A0L0BTE2_LUCCU|nr:hypothetical protein CVS40_12032 [Lucilia cuprina]KNC23312.1 hypothetical protein FF38_08355 [Lucilia cuprina]
MSEFEDVSMQEETLEGLLASWNLENMLQFLKDEKVSLDVLKILNFDQLQELTNSFKIGEKVLFCYHFQKWREQMDRLVRSENVFNKLRTISSSISPHIRSCESNCNSSYVEDCINAFEILKSNKIGCRIMDSYKITKTLTEDQRSLLINIIARHFNENNQHMSLQISYKLEEQILSIFPTEKNEFYRTERQGKIYAKYCNLKKSTSHIFDQEAEHPTTSKSGSNFEFNPEEGGKIIAQRLFYDNLSADEFESTWSACTNYRLQQIFKECGNISEIFKIWPQYKNPNGLKLIDKEFAFLYGSYDSILSWGGEKMIKLFNGLKKLKNGKSSEINKLLDNISIDDAKRDSDMFALKVLWVLHYWLVPTCRYARKSVFGKKEMARFSSKDS